MSSDWLALSIGNSRLHWAWFNHQELLTSWDTAYLTQDSVETLIAHDFDFSTIQISLPNQFLSCDRTRSELWIASVVEEQASLWRSYSNAHWIDLAQIPIHETYPTLGIDRALSLWGAIEQYGSPALVIDCGTAMTFTGADAELRLVGGAIAPGLKLQFEALGQKTSALPNVEVSGTSAVWARDTIAAIQSGVLNMTLAGMRSFVEDWRRQFSSSEVVLTGGDAELIYDVLRQRDPEFANRIRLDQKVAFWGMRSIRNFANSI